MCNEGSSSSNDIEDEIEMILGMYPDECLRDTEAQQRDESDRYTLAVYLPFHFQLQIVLPPSTYPDQSYPQLFVLSSPNTVLAAEFLSQLQRRMKDEIPLGVPCLAMLIPTAQAIAEELADAQRAQAEQLAEEQALVEEYLARCSQQLAESKIETWVGEPITDRRSKFIAHMAPIASEEDVREVVASLRAQKHIAIAAHPTIWAYRYVDSNGLVHQNCDDDGEKGASIKMMFLLDQLKVDGYVVIVTRWWGGILLGPDRFKHIMELTKNMLLTIPDREKELASKKKSGKH